MATLTLSIDPDAGIRSDYQLKTNSYDLGVDIELHDAVQRLRFEHPGVKTVVVTGGLDKIFCAGANIQMLAGASHAHKVNFCKFTNETRNSIEDATANSGQTWIAAVNGTAAGGGYELALACDEILLIDDRSSSVSLPEIPLLAVLPGTGGLTRVVDKRLVRRDLADAFSTRTEGVRGQTALDWGLVDHIAPASGFAELIAERAAARSSESDRPNGETGIELPPISIEIGTDTLTTTSVTCALDRATGTAAVTVGAPSENEPATGDELAAQGATSWLIRCARELDAVILHLRFNEPEIGTWVLATIGDAQAVLAAESVIEAEPDHWLVREARLLWARTFERLDLSARSLVAVIEPGSCFAGTLVELALAADRVFMLDGTWEDADNPPPPATMQLSDANLGWYPMANDLSRLQTRFWGRDDAYAAAATTTGQPLEAADAADAELVTFTPDDLDWHDELRLTFEAVSYTHLTLPTTPYV